MGLQQTYFNVIESVGVVEVCAIITSPLINCPVEFPFDVGLSTKDGTAGKTPSLKIEQIRLQMTRKSFSLLTNNSVVTVQTTDYGALNVLLTFDTCETRKCVNVSITDDGVDEPDEFFIFNLTRTSNLHSKIQLGRDQGQVQIIGGDGELIIYILPDMVQHSASKTAVTITLGYNSTLYVTSESHGIVELNIHLLHQPGGAPQPFTITVNTHNATASSYVIQL